MWITIIIVFYVIGIISAISAVMNVRTSQGTIAWVIFLLTFPYLGVPAYWILGRSRFHGYIVPRQSGDENIRKQLQYIYENLNPYCISSSEISAVGLAAEKLADLP